MAITLDGLTGVTAPSVTATGNISGTYILGNGYFLTNVAGGSSYGDANVAAYLPTYTGNLDSLTGNIITTANITAAYILPQSNATTDLGSNTLQWRSLYVSNNTIYIGGTSVGVADGQLTVAGNTVVTQGTSLAGNIDTSGNITGGNLITSGAIIGGTANVTSLDAFSGATGGIIRVKRDDGVTTVELDGLGTVTASANVTAGGFSTTGNLTAAYLLGNGAFITGLPAGYSNADVANYLPTYSGNISAGNITVTSNVSTNNLNVGTLLDVKDVSITGVILTDINLPGNVNPGNVNALGNVSGQYLNVSANVNAGNITVTHNAVILGNLRVEGTTTEINVANIFLQDKDIIVAANANATLSDLNGAGLQIGNISSGGNITFFYDSTSNTMALSHGANIANTLTVTGTVIGGNLQTSGTITGGAANVTSLDAFSGGTGGSIKVKSGAGVITVELDGSGTVTASSNVTAGGFSTTGNLTAAYLLGNGAFITGLPAGYSNADAASYLASNANVAILTTGNITTSGSIAATGNVTADNVNVGTLLDVKDIQITGQILTDINLAGNVNPGNVNALGNVTGAYLLGNGSQLTGISAGATIADDTTTNSNYYPVFATATSGSLTTATISSTKLTFNPSSGTLTATDVNTSSDRNFKKNVKNIKSALSKINSIQGVSFKWKETGNKSYGIIAQDLIKVLPELVHSEERGLTVSYLPLIAILIEAIKEQQQQIDQLKNTKPS